MQSETLYGLNLHLHAKVASLQVRINNRTNGCGAGNFSGAEGQSDILATSAGAGCLAWIYGRRTPPF